MSLGTFSLVVNLANIDDTARDARVDITPIPCPIVDDTGHSFYDRVEGVKLSGSKTWVLKTDTTSGNSTDIGYRVVIRTATKATPLVDTTFYARQAGATVHLDEVTPDVVEPISETAQYRTDALAAAAEAESWADIAEGFKDDAEAFGGTNDAIIAGRVNDTTPSLTRAALNALFGALRKIAATVTASGTAAVNKHNPVDASAGSRSIALPTGQPEGSTVIVEKEDSSANAVTITGSIRGVGSSSVSLVLQYESITFTADSAGSWWPTAGHKTKTSLDGIYAARAKRPDRQFPASHGLEPSVSDRRFAFICFGADANTIIACDQARQNGAPYSLAVSTDGGTTWVRRDPPPWTVTTAITRAWFLSTGTLLVLAGNTIWRSTDLGVTWTGSAAVLTLPTNVSTLMRGVARHSDGNVYLTEYATVAGAYSGGNARVWVSADDGATWSVHSSFPSTMDGGSGSTAIRHIHGVHSLPSGLYLTTGDNNTECAIWKLSGGSWTRATPSPLDANGAQRWRTVDIQERSGYIYWGRDASGISQGEVGKAPTSDLSAYQQISTLPTGCWAMDQCTDGTLTIASQVSPPGSSPFDEDQVNRLWTIDTNDVVREILRVPIFPGTTGQSEIEHKVSGNTIGLSTWHAGYDDGTNASGAQVFSTIVGAIRKGLAPLDLARSFGVRQPLFDPLRAMPARSYSGNTIVAPGAYTTSAPGTDREWAHPLWIPDDVSISTLYADVTVAGGTGALLRLGIRHDNNGEPGSLILEFGTVAATTTGVKSVAAPGAKALLLPRGMYWVTAAIQGAPNPVPTVVTRSSTDNYVPQGGGGAVFTAGRNALQQTGVTGAFPSAWTAGKTNPGVTGIVVWALRS